DGSDNDGNGYVDDLVGWNTIQGNNNPQTVSGGQTHGTHVAGIIGASTDNGVGVAGTAANVLIMPIRFYDHGQSPWTALKVAESYIYAGNNGARIINTSYTMDRGTFNFVDDPVYREGLQYFYDLGGLHVNSAGNQAEQNPNRAKLDQTLYVVNTDRNDRKAGDSNWGWG